MAKLVRLCIVVLACALAACGANNPNGPDPVPPPSAGGTQWVTLVKTCAVSPLPVKMAFRWESVYELQFSEGGIPFSVDWKLTDSAGIVVWKESSTGGVSFVSSKPGTGGSSGTAPKKVGDYTLSFVLSSTMRSETISSSCEMKVVE